MFLAFLLGFPMPPQPTGCVIDKCEDQICTVETPEGVVDIERKRGYEEGKEIICPLWLIDPT